jgi:hypothetical protein
MNGDGGPPQAGNRAAADRVKESPAAGWLQEDRPQEEGLAFLKSTTHVCVLVQLLQYTLQFHNECAAPSMINTLLSVI